jgi:hypothetical protein
MKYELTIVLELESRRSQERVARQFTSLFNFGTIKETIADGLHLPDDPTLLGVARQPKAKPNRTCAGLRGAARPLARSGAHAA